MMTHTHLENSTNQIVVTVERQFDLIFSAVSRKLQSTDIKLLGIFPAVSGNSIK